MRQVLQNTVLWSEQFCMISHYHVECKNHKRSDFNWLGNYLENTVFNVTVDSFFSFLLLLLLFLLRFLIRTVFSLDTWSTGRWKQSVSIFFSSPSFPFALSSRKKRWNKIKTTKTDLKEKSSIAQKISANKKDLTETISKQTTVL